MKIESIYLENFRCFGPGGASIEMERGVSVFVGGNGSGKTAAFQALSRLFGVTSTQRRIRRQDFHLPPDSHNLQSGATLIIEVVFSFPEIEGDDANQVGDAIPEFFQHMSASEPGGPLKARMRLQATWIDDGTSDGSIEEDFRWITTLDNNFDWDTCQRVQAIERGSIQFIYIPATRDDTPQVTNLLHSRLWRAARWSDIFRNRSTESARNIQNLFEDEEPSKFIIERFKRRWQQVHEADTDTIPVLRLIESRFEEMIRKVEFAFYPDEAGQERASTDLSDGQRSLFHIALTASMLEVEKDIFAHITQKAVFDHEKLRRTHLTFLAIEEPENSLSPFFLSRIVSQAREIGALESAQVALSSHSPAILNRIDPQEVRYFRLDRKKRHACIRRISMPKDDDEAHQYVRLAVRAHPEIYFARFVILGEGDSERFVIPRIAEAMGIRLDPSFVPIVPLGGRYVNHFWHLLRDLHIPYATLLDFDLGRKHGGTSLITSVIANLKEIGNDLSENSFVRDGTINLSAVDELQDNQLLNEGKNNNWIKALREEGIFFSFPLDIDFAMLRSFPEAYQHPHPGGRGPRSEANSIQEKKSVTLKTGGNPDLYSTDYDDTFKWYPYLFLNRSKPETHIAALARIADDTLAQKSPDEIRDLIQHVTRVLGLEDSA